jgi:hypothetical protein
MTMDEFRFFEMDREYEADYSSRFRRRVVESDFQDAGDWVFQAAAYVAGAPRRPEPPYMAEYRAFTAAQAKGDHSAVVAHAIELVKNAIEIEPAVDQQDLGQFQIVGVDEATTPWAEYGVTQSTDPATGRKRRDPRTIYNEPVQLYRDDPYGGWPIPA